MSVIRERIIFIDWFKTLSEDRFWRSLEPNIFSQIEKHLFSEPSSSVHNWMRGKISHQEICHQLATELSLSEMQLVDSLKKDAQNAILSLALKESIAALRKSHIMVLITDNMDIFAEETVPALGLEDLFDHIWISSSQGHLKLEENGKAFTEITKKFEIDIKQGILIDDTLNVGNLFKTLGGTSIQVKGIPHTEQTLVRLIESPFS